MSDVRVHNLAISLDGFATGEPQTLDTPFGHAGERLTLSQELTQHRESDCTAGTTTCVATGRNRK